MTKASWEGFVAVSTVSVMTTLTVIGLQGTALAKYVWVIVKSPDIVPHVKPYLSHMNLIVDNGAAFTGRVRAVVLTVTKVRSCIGRPPAHLSRLDLGCRRSKSWLVSRMWLFFLLFFFFFSFR